MQTIRSLWEGGVSTRKLCLSIYNKVALLLEFFLHKSILVGQAIRQVTQGTIERLQLLQFIMHYARLSVNLVTVLALPTFALPTNPIDKRADNHTLNRERADAVKAAFQHAWNGYKTYAFPHDELHPVSNSFSDSR
jgi:hypothetical protein